MKKSYQTKGKKELISFLSAHPDCQFTTEEICLALNGGEECGKSSIYRRLSELCATSVVQRFRNEERGCSVYQYIGEGCDCSRHFHQKCLQCGRIFHLECADSAAFAAHLLQEHGFCVDPGQSILYGVCAQCHKEEA